jgi:hypothetical protein
MKERICRDGDESIYQPRIHADRIRELYKIELETGLPLTVLVDYAIRSYIKAYDEKKRQEQALEEYDCRREDEAQDERDQHEFDDTDRWEDGTMYGY